MSSKLHKSININFIPKNMYSVLAMAINSVSLDCHSIYPLSLWMMILFTFLQCYTRFWTTNIQYNFQQHYVCEQIHREKCYNLWIWNHDHFKMKQYIIRHHKSEIVTIDIHMYDTHRLALHANMRSHTHNNYSEYTNT